VELGLAGKRVVVTASSAGIGKAIAESFLKERASVFLNGRDAEKLQKVVIEYRELFGKNNVSGFCGDVTKEDTLLSWRETIKAQTDAIDVLAVNLGSGKPISNSRLDDYEWERLLEVNLLSAVRCVRVFQPMLEKGKNASIIFISSIAACERGTAPYGYAAAKNGIRSLSKYLSGDYAKYGIRVNCILPGNVYFQGGRWEELKKEKGLEIDKFIEDNVPLNRFAKPEEIGDTAAFLASERSLFTTGAEIVIDGGQRRS